MYQPTLFDFSPKVYSISEINAYLRQKFEADRQLQNVWLEGEISNWKPAASGHIYFTLKDTKATIRCVIWRTTASQLIYRPQREGEAILAHGKISIYEAGGNYQFYVDDLEPAGQGALHAEFERIKAHLSAEGLFDADLKQPLPAFPKRIGVVTSPDAAALRDILNVLRRRYPLAQVVLSPTAVQGEAAPRQIMAALELLAQQPIDVIILARGGGSLEDLWAFNNEALARTIVACPIPVITGVGHETDFTIADFVADVRAPTPSAAAEIASPNRFDLEQNLAGAEIALTDAARHIIHQARTDLNRQTWALERLSPQNQVNTFRQQIDSLTHRAGRALQHRLDLQRQQIAGLASRLETLNPQATLSRGYAIVQKDNTVVSQTQQVDQNDRIVVKVSDGEFEAIVQTSGR
ncbi:MAG TPA: exodeoxyribonuclease VII large subunit [Anaerolineae bacterium]|nr:exodeoxyribonuclease VII large subunit [Anaerolineae bacterium]